MESGDSLYLEIILKESGKIEERFSNAETLTYNDLHILALKSQYAHISNLDTKLRNLQEKSEELEKKLETIQNGVNKERENCFIKISAENEGRLREVDKNFIGIKSDIDKRYGEIDIRISKLEAKIENSQKEIGKELANTIKWYIGGTGLILIFMKSLEVFGS
jgi:chaperonin cofactor prefoldin